MWPFLKTTRCAAAILLIESSLLSQNIEDEIADRAPIIENFTKVSEILVQNAQPGDKQDLSREIHHVTEALSSIVNMTADRRRTLENVLPLADEYYNDLEKLAQVISKVEDQLNTQRAFGAEPESIKEEIEEIKVRLCTFIYSVNQIWPITVNNVMGQSQIGANICNRCQAQEKRVNYVIIIFFSLFALNARKKGPHK